MKLIDKDAVVAEIEKWLKEIDKGFPNDHNLGRMDAYVRTVSFINTLEVKEVDIDSEIKEEYLKRRCYGGRDNMLVILNEPQFNEIAKHIFELGLKAKKGGQV